jgi:hypothetical protein
MAGPDHGSDRSMRISQDFRALRLTQFHQWITSSVRYDRNRTQKLPSRLRPRPHLRPDARCAACRVAWGGCAKIYREKASGVQPTRRELLRLLKALAPGDAVTVTRIDRFARSTFDLFAIVKQIVDAGAQFRSLAEPIRRMKGFSPVKISRFGSRAIRFPKMGQRQLSLPHSVPHAIGWRCATGGTSGGCQAALAELPRRVP